MVTRWRCLLVVLGVGLMTCLTSCCSEETNSVHTSEDGAPHPEDCAAKPKDDCAPNPQPDCGATAVVPAPKGCCLHRDRFWTALTSETNCHFTKSPLKSVAQHFEDRHGVPVHLDEPVLKNAGTLNETVDLSSSKSSLAATLDTLLTPLEMVWVIQHDAIWLTTRTEAERQIDTQSLSLEHCPKLALHEALHAVTQTVSPESWGANGTGRSVIVGRKFVVRQTWWNLRKTSELLWQLQDEIAAAP